MGVNRLAAYWDEMEAAKSRTQLSPSFARAVDTLLATTDMTDTELAARIEISQATITNYRKGQAPGYNSKPLRKFCRHFGVSLPQLLKGKIVEAASDPANDLHSILDELLASDVSDTVETMLRALWSTHASRPNRKT